MLSIRTSFLKLGSAKYLKKILCNPVVWKSTFHHEEGYGYRVDHQHGEHLHDAEPQKRTGPLDGVRVCDLSRVLAGPYCTQILGDMGAEVIKVERPGVGDDTRHFGPPFVDGESCYYLSINRNKKSIAIDMKKPEGKDIIFELVKSSDVFVENFAHGKIDALGFGYEELKKINPSLVYASICGFGFQGPERNKPGYDLIAQAVGGLMSITGPEGGNSCIVGISITDIMTGMYANGAILSALYERMITGKGKKIDTSLLQTQVAFLCHVASNYLNTGRIATRHGTAHGTIVPYQAFATADGREIALAAANNKHFQNAMKALDLSEHLEDARFESNPKRVENRKELINIIEDKMQTQTCEHWLEKLNNVGVPCGRVNNVKEVFEMPQVAHLDLVQSIPHPTIGRINVAGSPVAYNGESVLHPPVHPPILGEHTVDVLKELNYSDHDIKTLLEKNVIEDGSLLEEVEKMAMTG